MLSDYHSPKYPEQLCLSPMKKASGKPPPVVPNALKWGRCKQRPLNIDSLKVVFVLELLYTSTTVSKLLLTCEEWVALWAYFDSHSVSVRKCSKGITTCASNFTFLIIRMDSFLHASSPFLKSLSCALACYSNSLVIITKQSILCKGKL